MKQLFENDGSATLFHGVRIFELAKKGSTLFPKKTIPNIFQQDRYRGFYIVCITSWRHNPSHRTNGGNSLHVSSTTSVEYRVAHVQA